MKKILKITAMFLIISTLICLFGCKDKAGDDVSDKNDGLGKMQNGDLLIVDDGKSDYVVVWRGQADLVEKYVKKGTQLYIEGRLRSRSWEDQTGAKRYAIDIVADTIQLLGRRSEGQPQQGGYPAQQPAHSQPAQQPQQSFQQPGVQPAAAPAAQPKPSFEDLPSDDLPF